MAGRKWEPTKQDAKKLNAFIKAGTTVYTITDNVKSELYDPHCYVAHTFTHRAPFTGHWMAGHKSAWGLLSTEGTVYENQPSGMRRVGDPGPSCLDEFDLAQIRRAGSGMGWRHS
ncbi:hypothetical protein [Streptomyces sp. NPDC058108]|uniref:hypothetical protein n=1 Tax=Streptomyces sp. NPDC058108 TaxID=3346344 RepID=UPI0036E299B4